jgi:hypothetical protein
MIGQIRHLQSRVHFETFSIELSGARVIQIHDKHLIATTDGTQLRSHEDFDSVAEEALTEFGAPLALIDQIKNTRLFDSASDGVSFAHDLLVRHLTAAKIASSRYPGENELVSILDQPLYRPLVGDVIG